MGMDLKPIKPSENAPLYEGGEVQWGRYNWSGWSWLRTHLEDWGVDTSELTSMNDGATIDYPYAYASGIFKGSLSGLRFVYQIPGVEIKDYKKFEEYINQRVSECETDIERFRNK